jgi:hypothetical protein
VSAKKMEQQVPQKLVIFTTFKIFRRGRDEQWNDTQQPLHPHYFAVTSNLGPDSYRLNLAWALSNKVYRVATPC